MRRSEIKRVSKREEKQKKAEMKEGRSGWKGESDDRLCCMLG